MRISVVSCVNDFEVYHRCVASSFRQREEDGDVELIAIDNTAARWSAPSALNEGWKKANGEILVFCHQDVIFPHDWPEQMLRQIAKVEKIHKNWGVLGPYGVSMTGKCVGNVIDPHRSSCEKRLPVVVQSLDELCLITRRNSGLRFDERLGGFHFYGADICLEAMTNGMTNFAIDACVQHLSPGPVDEAFVEMANRLFRKWSARRSPKLVIETTCGIFRIGSGFATECAYVYAGFRRAVRRRLQRLSRSILPWLGKTQTQR